MANGIIRIEMKKIFLYFLLLPAYSAAQTVTLPATWKFIQQDKPEFKRSSYSDEDWVTVQVPGGWTKLGLNKERTIGWYRASIILPENLLNKDLVLFAGTIDDADETYFNGELIGATGKFPPGDQSAWDTERKYIIPKKLVRQNNVIAIRVYNGIGDGGIYSGNLLLMAKKDYDKQVAEQIKNKKSYYQLTTSNGSVAAVYNERTQVIENFYPHIFSYYDSGLVVKPVMSNIKLLTSDKPVSAQYVRNTHVIEVKYPAFSVFYYNSFMKQDKILYAVVRGKEDKVKEINFTGEEISGRTRIGRIERQNGSLVDRYFLFGFEDTLNRLPDMDFAIQQAPAPEDEIKYMTNVFTSCKIPKSVSTAERNVIEQGIAVLKMSQVTDKEVFPMAKGQVMASLRPGVWAICWVRDGAFAIEAMSKLGMLSEAKKALEFMLSASPTNQYVNYLHTDGIDYGIGVPYIISLTRYFGNGREESDYNENGPNIEIDDLGLFLTAFYHYVNESGDVSLLRKWEKEIRIIGNAIIHNITEKGIIRRDSGPWEHHLPGKEFMWASGTCARGLQLISELQKKNGMEYETFEKGAARLSDGIIKNCLIENKYIKGNATEQSLSDHHYFDAATFELFAGGLFTDKKLFFSHMLEYNKHNRAVGDAGRGYIRFNSDDSYENQEWPFAGLRVAVAQKKLGSITEAKKMIDRITLFASRNHNLIPEILSNDLGLYKGAIPMVGYGSGAYILAVLEYYKK